MRTIIAAAAARTQRPFARIAEVLSRSSAGRARKPRGHRAADALSDHLLGDLGLAPLARPTDSRALLGGARRPRSRTDAVHEIDFAYYAALARRKG